jgi:hypothetical protein
MIVGRHIHPNITSNKVQLLLQTFSPFELGLIAAVAILIKVSFVNQTHRFEYFRIGVAEAPV